MAKGVQYDFFPVDVVPQTVFSPADSPLPFAGLQPREFLSVVLSASVVWVFSKNSQKIFQRLQEHWIAL